MVFITWENTFFDVRPYSRNTSARVHACLTNGDQKSNCTTVKLNNDGFVNVLKNFRSEGIANFRYFSYVTFIRTRIGIVSLNRTFAYHRWKMKFNTNWNSDIRHSVILFSFVAAWFEERRNSAENFYKLVK